MVRKSDASARFANSATAPASSTPVGPPPTTTKFNSRQRRGRDLVEQWLEQVIIVAVYQGDVERSSGEGLCRGEPAEARSDDDHAGTLDRDLGSHDGSPEPGLSNTRFLPNDPAPTE